MRVIRRQLHKQIHFIYSLENVQSVKYLGKTNSDNTDWARHNFLNVIQIQFPSQEFGLCTLEYKGSCIKTLVWPKLEYAAPIIKLRKFRGQDPTGPAGDGEIYKKCLQNA